MKSNPPLIIWGNPQGKATIKHVRKMSDRVIEMRYKHEQDGELYKHPFAPGIEMHAVTIDGKRCIVLVGKKGQPLWDEYPDPR